MYIFELKQSLIQQATKLRFSISLKYDLKLHKIITGNNKHRTPLNLQKSPVGNIYQFTVRLMFSIYSMVTNNKSIWIEMN